MRASSVVAAAGLCLAIVGAAPPVHAFCRTTTTIVPPGYNPVVNGCWTGGAPLAWKLSRVPIGVISSASSQVSLADATRVENSCSPPGTRSRAPDRARASRRTTTVPSRTSPSAVAPATRATPPRTTTSRSTTPHGRTTRTTSRSRPSPLTSKTVVSSPPTSRSTRPSTRSSLRSRLPQARTTCNRFSRKSSGDSLRARKVQRDDGGHVRALPSRSDRPHPDDGEGLCPIYPPASSPSGGSNCAVQPLRADDVPLGVVGSGLVIGAPSPPQAQKTRAARVATDILPRPSATRARAGRRTVVACEAPRTAHATKPAPLKLLEVLVAACAHALDASGSCPVGAGCRDTGGCRTAAGRAWRCNDRARRR